MKTYFTKITLIITIVLSASGLTFAKSILYYGEKSGLFTPCKGNLVTVCKKIDLDDVSTGDDSSLSLGRLLKVSKSEPTVTITQGDETITIPISQFNFEDGSVKGYK